MNAGLATVTVAVTAGTSRRSGQPIDDNYDDYNHYADCDADDSGRAAGPPIHASTYSSIHPSGCGPEIGLPGDARF